MSEMEKKLKELPQNYMLLYAMQSLGGPIHLYDSIFINRLKSQASGLGI